MSPESPPPLGLLARLASRSVVVARALLSFALVAALAVAAAWLLTPEAYTQRFPGEEALGTPALGDYRAARDYDIVDEEATRALRDAAAAGELPVYDYDEAASETAAARVRGAFSAAREAMASARPRAAEGRSRAAAASSGSLTVTGAESAASSGSHPVARGGSGASSVSLPLPGGGWTPGRLQRGELLAAPGRGQEQGREVATADRPAQPKREQTATAPRAQSTGWGTDPRRALAAFRPELEAALGLTLGELEVVALADGRFSEALEEHLVALANRALGGKVVADRARLLSERERGIVARNVRDGVEQGEHVIAHLGVVRDIAEARADVERAAAALPPSIPAPQRAALARIATALARPTLVFNLAETEWRRRAAAERARPAVVQVRRGEKIVGDGERIERRHLVMFQGIRAQTRPGDVLRVRLGAGVLVASLLVLLWRHARRNCPRFRPSARDALLLAVALATSCALAAAGLALGDLLHDRMPAVAPETVFYLVPFAAGAMVVRSVLSAEVALLFSVASGALVGLVAGHSLLAGIHALLTSIVAAGLVARMRHRAALFRVGVAVGALGALLVAATHLLTGRAPAEAVAPALAALAGGSVLLPVLVVATLPVVEHAFGYLTDVKLLELASLNQPALKDLIVQAPGTYHHAVIVGSLVEAAAEAIGANPLLARVCAYYHDIGKIRNPLYFAENQRGEDRHDQLAPSMSALIVKRHVADGLELARQWRLPAAVTAAIREHHGTRFVSFWARSAEAPGRGDGALEELFRYAGPRPQSRETALVMIADACEASARSLREPTPERLRALVKRRIEEISSEGQLDDCELTLKDLNATGMAMVRGLEAVYRSRPGDAGAAPSMPPAPLQVVRRGGP